jgi:hypothetical protein
MKKMSISIISSYLIEKHDVFYFGELSKLTSAIAGRKVNVTSILVNIGQGLAP